MTQRTDTRHQTAFHHPDQGVTLDFVEQRKIKFTLAAGSRWRFPSHWHDALHHGCRRIHCLQGRMLVSTATPYGGSGTSDGDSGTYVTIRPGDLHSWKSRYPDQELIVLLEVEDEGEVLYRNTSSATVDANRFPFLSSTPYWIRLLYSLLAFWPAAQSLMIARLLWIQLQVIYFKHDFWLYHGSMNAPYLWFLTHPYSFERPPEWVFNINWWSIGVISKATQGACYYLGRLFLGMKAEYSEYTPGDAAATSRNVKQISQEKALHEPPNSDKAASVDDTSVG